MNKNELYFVKILRKLKHTRKKESNGESWSKSMRGRGKGRGRDRRKKARKEGRE